MQPDAPSTDLATRDAVLPAPTKAPHIRLRITRIASCVRNLSASPPRQVRTGPRASSTLAPNSARSVPIHTKLTNG